MVKPRGGKRDGSGRKPLPPYLQRVKLTGVRLPAYKLDAIKTQGEPTALIEAALDEKYAELFQDVLNKRNETDNESLQATQEGAATYGGEE